MGVGQWGEQSGWTAGKQPGAGSNIRQPELCLTPGAPCPLHCPAPCCRDRDRLGLEFGKSMQKDRAEPGNMNRGWERAPAEMILAGESLAVGEAEA